MVSKMIYVPLIETLNLTQPQNIVLLLLKLL